MVTARFSQIMMEREEEEAGKTTRGRDSREKFTMQMFVVWLKESLGNIRPGLGVLFVFC